MADPLPPIVQDRLETELNSITAWLSSTVYIAQKLVWKPLQMGIWLVREDRWLVLCRKYGRDYGSKLSAAALYLRPLQILRF